MLRLKLGEFIGSDQIYRPNTLALILQPVKPCGFDRRVFHCMFIEPELFGKHRRRAFKTLARYPPHFDAAMFLIFRACFGTGTSLSGNGKRLCSGGEFVFQFPKRFFAGAFCDLKASQLFGQLFFVFAQARDLACENIGPPFHRFLLGSNICAALVHVGDPAFRFASAFLPSPDFGKRDCTAFADLCNALFK